MELLIFPCLLLLALYSLYSCGGGTIGNFCTTSMGSVGQCSKIEQCRNGVGDSQKRRWTQNTCAHDLVCCDRKNRWSDVRQSPTSKQIKKAPLRVHPGSGTRPPNDLSLREGSSDFYDQLHNKSSSAVLSSVPEDAIVFPDFFDNLDEPAPRLDGPEQKAGSDKNKASEKNKCPSIPEIFAVENSTRTGRKAYDKCLDYAELVFPCQKVPGSDVMERKNICVEPGFHLSVVGGIEALVDEFPHMVILGYGDDLQEVAWRCGGSLISERFVMTAGHCIYHPSLGPLKFARFGAHRLTDKPTPEQVLLVASITKHPEYKPPSKYNDIALAKLEREVTFSASVRPACLNLDPANEQSGFMAAGWGATENAGTMSDVLLYVALGGFTFEECSKSNKPSRLLRSGLMEQTQICAGDLFESKDTCQGDSGGPLQKRNPDIYCSFSIIGITSFGKGCGTPGVPGVYTKVSAFVPWIETIVWP